MVPNIVLQIATSTTVRFVYFNTNYLLQMTNHASNCLSFSAGSIVGDQLSDWFTLHYLVCGGFATQYINLIRPASCN